MLVHSRLWPLSWLFFFKPFTLHLDQIRHDVFVGFFVHCDLVSKGSLSRFKITPLIRSCLGIKIVLMSFESVDLFGDICLLHIWSSRSLRS